MGTRKRNRTEALGFSLSILRSLAEDGEMVYCADMKSQKGVCKVFELARPP